MERILLFITILTNSFIEINYNKLETYNLNNILNILGKGQKI